MTRRISVTSVFLVSTATLAYEILLVRAFAIQYFHHFAFMAIGVAMLGTGVAGVVLALVNQIELDRGRRWFVWLSVFTSLALVLSPLLVDRIAMDPTQLLWDASQWVRLGFVYVLLAAPFGLGATVVLLGLILEPEQTGRVYGASFLGAACGALLSLVASAVLMPDRALAVPAAAGALAALTAVRVDTVRGSPAASAFAVIVATLAIAAPPWTVYVSPHKAMPQVEAFPDAERLAERTGPAGWAAAVRAPAFRYAPGLSLMYRGEVPNQVAVFLDGGLVGAVPVDTGYTDLHEWLPSGAPYAIGDRSQVLVLGAGGGSEVASAVHHGVERVTAVEPHRDVLRLLRTVGERRLEEKYSGVEWVVADARSFVAGTADRYDLIALQPSGGLGGNAGGLHSLNEDFLHTVEAYEAYLRVARPHGLVAITAWLSAPPREAVRMILTAGRALRAVGADPSTCMLIVRSWATVTVLMQREAFASHDVAAVRTWGESRQFDFDWYPGIAGPESRFNALDEPAPYRAALAVAQGDAEAVAFAASYPFEVSPATDARPYPNHFLRPSGLITLVEAGAGAALPFAELGLLAAIATLAQSIVVGAVLLLVPVAVSTWRKRRPVSFRLIAYFSAIGVAYMVVEIAAIQQLTLLLGHVQYAVAAVLAAFLIGSGIGSIQSDRSAVARGRVVVFSLAASFLMFAALMLRVVHLAHPTPLLVRVLVTFGLVMPPAVLMGFPFPLGLRRLAGDDRVRRAWAWAGNGFASVVATPFAALMALEFGSPALFLVGAAAYGVAGIVWK